MKKLSIFLLIIGVLIYFISTLWLSFDVPLFNSPDENAAFFAAYSFAEGDLPRVKEMANWAVGGAIHPRSMIAVEDYIVPGSFLGLPIYFGALGSIFGAWVLKILTPLLFILSGLAFYKLVRVFAGSKEIALYSTIFYICHPAMWYYAGRTMMHNVPFISFAVFSAFFLYVKPISRRWMNWLAAGCFLGISISMRSSEIIWLIPLFAAFVGMLMWRDGWRHAPIFLFGIILAIIPILLHNQSLYGSVLETGYTIDFNYPRLNLDVDNPDSRLNLDVDKSSFLPFGFHEKAILRHIWQYGFLLYPWMTVFGAAGIVIALFRPKNKKWFYLAIATLFVSAWLAILYGSWVIHDNPDPNAITIGNSYARYWIPIFTLLAPFAGLAISIMLNHLKKWKLWAASACMACIILLSSFVVFGGEDGFIQTRQRLLAEQEMIDSILEKTESDSIIITDFSDKHLFPARRIVHPLRDEHVYENLGNLFNQAPLYYIGITFPDSDLDFLRENRLTPHGIDIELIEQYHHQSLYKFIEQ